MVVLISSSSLKNTDIIDTDEFDSNMETLEDPNLENIGNLVKSDSFPFFFKISFERTPKS